MSFPLANPPPPSPSSSLYRLLRYSLSRHHLPSLRKPFKVLSFHTYVRLSVESQRYIHVYKLILFFIFLSSTQSVLSRSHSLFRAYIHIVCCCCCCCSCFCFCSVLLVSMFVRLIQVSHRKSIDINHWIKRDILIENKLSAPSGFVFSVVTFSH